MGACAAQARRWGPSSRSMPMPAISTRSRDRTSARAAKFACGSFPRKTRPASSTTHGASCGKRLARVLTMQKQAITPVDNAMRTLSQTDRLAAQGPRRPQQRGDDSAPGDQPASIIATKGVGARITRMLDDLQNFKIDNADAQKQMEDMLAQAGVRFANSIWAQPSKDLTRATKSLDGRGRPSEAMLRLRPARIQRPTSQPQPIRRKPTQKARRRRVRLRLPPRRLSRKNLHLESNLSVRPRRAPSAGTRQREATSR